MFNPVIFREYDIRGVYEKDYDLEFCKELGAAFCRFVRKKNPELSTPLISIGFDARLSSPEIEKNVIQGIRDEGGDVLSLGLVTTPISYFSMFQTDAHGGIMITGSHNPPDYNGFKISLGKTTIFGDEIQELQQVLVNGKDKSIDRPKGKLDDYDIFKPYLEKYIPEFSGIENIKVVLDCGNGAAGVIARKLYEGVGLKPIILFEEPDGNFPNHHPDPTVEENLEDLKKSVLENKADIGIGFDGDADRIAIIDENATPILGDELMILVSRYLLETNPGSKIIGDVKCSNRLYEDINRLGGKAIMWKTGHSLIKNKIKEEGAPFGGELSGHIFFADKNYGYDDALYAGLRLIEILAKTGKKPSELLEGLPKVFNTPEIRIDTTEEKKQTIVKILQEKFSEDTESYKVNMIDGVRISYEDGWALARASNTQPVLVLRFEANSQKALDRIQGEIESLVNPLL
jgi:phosphomannomutase/phosphomannomutase/phosphoglucomutase